MSQLYTGIDLSGVMQNGILGGIAAGQRQQGLEQSAQQQALHAQVVAQELSDRKARAAELLRTLEADEQVSRALLNAPTGPRPQNPMAGYQAAGLQTPGPVADLQQMGQGNQPQAAPPAGIAAPAPGAPAGPAQQAAPPQWYDGVSPLALAHASPHIQDMVVRAKAGRSQLLQARQDAHDSYNQMKIAGLHKFAEPKQWDEWMHMGVPVDINDAPQEVRDRTVNKAAAIANAQIDLMTIHDPTEHGQQGPPHVNAELRARLMASSPEAVSVFFQDWQNQQRVERQIQLLAGRGDQALSLEDRRQEGRLDLAGNKDAASMARLVFKTDHPTPKQVSLMQDPDVKNAYSAVSDIDRNHANVQHDIAALEHEREGLMFRPDLKDDEQKVEAERINKRLETLYGAKDTLEGQRRHATAKRAAAVQAAGRKPIAPAPQQATQPPTAGPAAPVAPATTPAPATPPQDATDAEIDSIIAAGITDPAAIKAELARRHGG